ncbi:MAG: CPBP family intramembrane metalloprotease [Pirellulales bacterium]|nr:CPBP family intramembrane metalloprotease [Pirellulales bacterium]
MRILLTVFWNSAEHRLRFFWRFLLHSVALVASILVVSIAMGLAFLIFDGGDDLESSGWMWAFAVTQNLALVLTVVAASIWPDRRTIGALGLRLNRRWWLDCGGGFVLGALLMTMIFWVQWAMGWLEFELRSTSWRDLFLNQGRWLVAMMAVGIGEEVLSRGHHLKNLCEGFRFLGLRASFVVASLISSGLFAAFHLFNPGASIASSVSIFLAGVTFCVARLKTGSLAAPIGLHFSWNYFQGSVFGFSVSGNVFAGSLLQTTQSGPSFFTGGSFGPEAGLLGYAGFSLGLIVFFLWPKPEEKLAANLVQLCKRQSWPLKRITSPLQFQSNDPAGSGLR